MTKKAKAQAASKNRDASELVQVPLSELIPYARNSRTHSDEQVAQIAGSIKAFGFVNPVLVDESSVLIAGHGRLLAAQKLKLETVPAIVLRGLSETEKRALVIADNRIAMNAGWDDEMLRLELSALQDDDFSLDLLGFDDDELQGFLSMDNLATDLPDLPDGDKESFQQMTFTLHDEQAEQVKAALEKAKAMGPFADTNENENGNALARACEMFLRGGE